MDRIPVSLTINVCLGIPVGLAFPVAASGWFEDSSHGVDVGDTTVVIAALTHTELLHYLS